MENAKQHMARNVIWNSFGSLFYLGCQWIITILVTRIAGFYDAGVLSLAVSISAVFQTVAMFGIRNFQVSDVDDQYSASTYVGFRGISCAVSLLFCLVASLVLGYRGDQFLAILFYMLFRIAESYSDVLYGIAQKKGRLDINGKGFTVKGVLLLASFLGTYLLTKSLPAALACMAASSFLSTLFFDLMLVRRLETFRLLDNLKKCLSLAKETVPLFIYLFLFSTLTTIPKLFLEGMYDETALGAYSSIFSIAMLFQMATTYIYTPFVQYFADLYKKRDLSHLFSVLLKVVLAMVVLAAVTLIGAAFLGEFVFVLVFGESIREYLYLLTPILISIFILSLMGFLFMLEIVIRDFKGLLLGNFAGFAACCGLTPLMIHKCGINGTSYGLILSALLAVAIVCSSMAIKLFGHKEVHHE